MNKTVISAAIVAMAASLEAQDSMRANVRGSGDRGKCTIEVEVDGAIDVEIRGEEARIRTLSGAPGVFRRFDCNARPPREPFDFRFRGVDGRGSQRLIQEPMRGRVAVVRIEDPKGGRQGYTFDFEWRGGAADGGGGDWDRPSRPGWDRPGSGGGWDRPGSGGGFGNNDWNRQVDFRGRGDGYYRGDRGRDERLSDCEVSISRRGDVRASFETDRRNRISLDGRITRIERDRVWADVSGYGIRGSMMILLDRDRVREVSLDSSGRDRAELRWRDR